LDTIRTMQRLIEFFGGLWEMLLLGWRTRFSLSGRYWRWRIETAFGSDPSRWPPRRQRLRAMLDYARWVYRMKRRR
jgi:hypothetical protein